MRLESLVLEYWVVNVNPAIFEYPSLAGERIFVLSLVAPEVSANV